MIRLTYKHSEYIDPILYLTGFKQQLYLETHSDAPTIAIQEEPFENGFGVEIGRYARLENIVKFQVLDIPDAMMLSLELVRYHDEIKVMDLDTEQEHDVIEYNVSFTGQENGLNTASFELTIEQITVSGCAENPPLNELC